MSSKYLARIGLLVLVAALRAGWLHAQSTAPQLQPILSAQLQSPDVVEYQLKEYLMEKVARLPAPSTSAAWSAEADRIRKHLLQDVVYHGWPQEWVNSPPRFEDVGVISSGDGYRIRKLRYDVVPGFYSSALLYEPATISGKVPAILNVNGHDYKLGKASEFKQKRCINFAKRGIIALSLEWLECGELFDKTNMEPEDRHWAAAYLDLVGTSSIGLFYLEMRRGLDYLYNLPNVDRERIGMTGLSGGGWQTITLSSLDTRVRAAVPVAGFASLVSQIERHSDAGDMEQSPADFYVGIDNAHLVAMMAPRPTLLIFDAEDDCCYRAPLVKPYVFDQVRPFFDLYGRAEDFQMYENRDPGTHNYQLNNRLQAYRFFSEHFHLPVITSEIPSDAEIKTFDELKVGLPENNLTALRLARQLALEIKHGPVSLQNQDGAAAKRDELRSLVRYRDTALKHPWAIGNTKNRGVESRSYRLEMNNHLSATGVWMKAISTPDNAPTTIVLNDEGKRHGAQAASGRVNRGEQVLALDLLLTGDSAPDAEKPPHLRQYMVQALAMIGDRALGVEAGQLVAAARWLRGTTHTGTIRLDCTGIRSQTVGLITAALQPTLFSEVEIHHGMPSFGYLLSAPVSPLDAPELFALDLYKDFDLDQLTGLASPTTVARHEDAENSKPEE